MGAGRFGRFAELCLPARGGVAVLAGVLLLAACSSTPQRFPPSPLPADPQLLKVQPAWSSQLGAVDFALISQVVGNTVALADSAGGVVVLDTESGTAVWRVALATALSAGVGFDGRWAAVVSRDNELIVLESGRELWRQRLAAQSYTAPLVAGERVFVLGADRSVTAFDARSGRRLWLQQRPGEPLVLRQAGVLLAVGNTLVAGLSGKLVGLDPLTGAVRWEAPVAMPRGTNDVERLVDLVAPFSREGSQVCVRAFQAAVACVDAARGTLLWSRPAHGYVGLGGDAQNAYGSEADGTLVAWRRSDGERLWTQTQLLYRGSVAPLRVGNSLVVADDAGWLHFMKPQDGSMLTRVATGEQALAAAPVRVGEMVLSVSRAGKVQAWRVAD